MTAIRPDLVATCWTSSGTARPGDADEASPLSPLERLEAIADTGYVGCGFVLADLIVVRDTIGFAALRKRADDLGLGHVEVEVATGWWLGARDASWRRDWELLLEAAKALRSPFIKVAPPPGDPVASLRPLVRPLRRLAEEAGEAGTAVALETLPFAGVETVPRGARLMREVGHERAGLVVDLWHVVRAGTSCAELSEHLVPASVFAVEVDDADSRSADGATLFEDTRDHRRYPGEGAQDVEGFVRTMADLGFGGPWGVEILSEEHRRRPLREALEVARDTTRGCLERAAAARGETPTGTI